MEQITNDQFEQMLTKQSQYDTKKWIELQINKIYTIVNYKTVKTPYGESMILILSDDTEVWTPEHLKEKIEKTRQQPPYYIRPLGLKQSKNNKKNKYHAYDFVVPTKLGV